MLRGNNDYFSDLPQEEEFVVEGNHIFITHGHYYYVSMGESDLLKEAKGRDADIVMYGHTHKPSLHDRRRRDDIESGKYLLPAPERASEDLYDHGD